MLKSFFSFFKIFFFGFILFFFCADNASAQKYDDDSFNHTNRIAGSLDFRGVSMELILTEDNLLLEKNFSIVKAKLIYKGLKYVKGECYHLIFNVVFLGYDIKDPEGATKIVSREQKEEVSIKIDVLPGRRRDDNETVLEVKVSQNILLDKFRPKVLRFRLLFTEEEVLKTPSYTIGRKGAIWVMNITPSPRQIKHPIK